MPPPLVGSARRPVREHPRCRGENYRWCHSVPERRCKSRADGHPRGRHHDDIAAAEHRFGQVVDQVIDLGVREPVKPNVPGRRVESPGISRSASATRIPMRTTISLRFAGGVILGYEIATARATTIRGALDFASAFAIGGCVVVASTRQQREGRLVIDVYDWCACWYTGPIPILAEIIAPHGFRPPGQVPAL